MTKGLFSLAVRLLRAAAASAAIEGALPRGIPSRGKSKFPVLADYRQTPISPISVAVRVIDLYIMGCLLLAA